jgi:uncharacterized membrane protein YhaH (DUF805 family)
MNWYLIALKKYVEFDGRARRKEYWMFALFNLLITLAIAVIEAIIGTPGFLGLIYALAVLLPAIAVSVRRLHDTDRSGWWLLIALVPIVGAIVLLVFMVQDSKPGTNLYGIYPKTVMS